MTYLQFHLLFNVPILLALFFLARNRLTPTHWKWIGLLVVLVTALVTPWDNWAVYKGIWSFDWQRTTPVQIQLGGVLWKLPAEEYAFFVVETVMVSLLAVLFLRPGGKERP